MFHENSGDVSLIAASWKRSVAAGSRELSSSGALLQDDVEDVGDSGRLCDDYGGS